MNIVLASHNQGKIREFNFLLTPFHYHLIPQANLGITDIEETGKSFVENAILKARHAAQASGLPALADDSGLVVAALNGEPGIYSARYAGTGAPAESHIQKLLAALKDVPAEKRQAYYYCVLVFMKHPQDPTPLIVEGQWHGLISDIPRGKHGFGYDPIFYIANQGQTAAELSPEIKNTISHRAIALQAFIKRLNQQT